MKVSRQNGGWGQLTPVRRRRRSGPHAPWPSAAGTGAGSSGDTHDAEPTRKRPFKAKSDMADSKSPRDLKYHRQKAVIHDVRHYFWIAPQVIA